MGRRGHRSLTRKKFFEVPPHQYADCLEKAFAPRSTSFPEAASEGDEVNVDKNKVEEKKGAMSITPSTTSQLGRISEDTAYLSVWCSWGLEADIIFNRLERCRLEAQGKADTFSPDENPEVVEDMDFDPDKVEFADSMDSSAYGGERFIEGSGGGCGEFEFGGIIWYVMPYGKGGKDFGGAHYRYQLVSGGIKIFIRRESSETVSNMWIEIGSIPLCVKGGLKPVCDELWAIFKSEGIIFEKNILSRVDIYADFDHCDAGEMCDKFYENARITRARKEANYSQLLGYGGEINFSMHSIGGRKTGFAIGTETHLRVYDKRFEMQRDPIKWGVFADKYDGIPETLTRVEFQLRRNALKSFALDETGEKRIEGYESYLEVRERLWKSLTTDWFRLIDKPVDKENNHQSRAKTWPAWEVVQCAVNASLDVIRRIKRRVEVDCSQLLKMGLGCLVKSALYVSGKSMPEPVDVLTLCKTMIISFGREYYNKTVNRHCKEKDLYYGKLLNGV